MSKTFANEKGSVTLFVVVAMLFFMLFLLTMYMNLSNKIMNKNAEIAKIQKNYEDKSMDEEYERIMNEDQDGEEPIDPPSQTGELPVAPDLSDGMIPIKYNESTEEWIKTVPTDPEWYDYNTKKWANIVLEEATFNGNVLDETKPYCMFVWVPRYAYKIESGWHSDEAGDIEIVFIDNKDEDINGKKYEGEYNYINGTYTDYVVHPAFNYGNNNETKLNGFWVGKFNACPTEYNTSYVTGKFVFTGNEIITIRANNLCKYFTIQNAFDTCINMNKVGNQYGLNTNDEVIDPHMLKNTEYGAIAYLSESKYGEKNEKTNVGEYDYKTEQGKKASSNGNVTGIYDINSGVVVAAYAYNATEASKAENGNYKYGVGILNAEARYKDVYKITDIDDFDMEENSDKYGDAVYETSIDASTPGVSIKETLTWDNELSFLPERTRLFWVRTGRFGYGSRRGNGSADTLIPFRVVLPVL